MNAQDDRAGPLDYVRFAQFATKLSRRSGPSLRANCGVHALQQKTALVDDLVGEREHS